MRQHTFIFLILFWISSIFAQDLIIPKECVEYTRTDSLKMSEQLFDEAIDLCSKKDYTSAIQRFKKVIYLDSLMDTYTVNLGTLSISLRKDKRKYMEEYARWWIAYCEHSLGNDSVARRWYLWNNLKPFDRKLVIRTDSIKLEYNSYDISPVNKKEYIKMHSYATRLDSITFGRYSPRYFKSLQDLQHLYTYSHDYDTSLKILFELKEIGDKIMEPTSELYCQIIGDIGITYNSLYEYSLAIEFLERYNALTGGRESEFQKNFYNRQLNTLIHCYTITKQPEKAFSILRTRIINCKKNEGEQKSYTLGSGYLQAKKDYASALFDANYMKEALREYLSIETIQVYRDEQICNDIAACYLALGDSDNALHYIHKAENITDKIGSLEYNSQTDELHANAEFLNGNFKKAIELQNYIVKKDGEKTKNNSGSYFYTNYDGYYRQLSRLAFYYIADKQFDKAIDHEMANLQFKRNFYKIDSPVLGESYLNIGEAYAGKKQIKAALMYTQKAYQLMNGKVHENHRALTNLIKYYTQLGDFISAEHYLSILYSEKQKQLFHYFSELTEQEKQLYWNKNHIFFTQFVPEYAEWIGSDRAYGILYNSILDSKGIILDSEKVLKRSVLESGDKKLKDTYHKIQEYKQIVLNELSNEVINHVLIDSLTNKVNALEDELIIHSKNFRDLAMWKKCNWKDIQNKITIKDVAIEFLTMKTHKGKEIYAALVIRKDASAPIFIELCKKERLIQLYRGENLNSKEIDRMIWKPLTKLLEGIDRIYFSPADFLYNYGIEYAEEVTDKKILRLSTTKELITPKIKTNNGIDALLIGGLDYNARIHHSVTTKNELSVFESMRDFNLNELRGSNFRYLPYTRKEVVDIDRTLSKGQNCVLLLGNEGTEEMVRHFSGQSPRIIHIATHGAYIQKEDSRRIMNTSIVPVNGSTCNILTEDASLTRSFLLLSGCNPIISSDNYVDQKVDGVLTAQEISQLDLRGSELISLSACQTGLGDITQDGVIGLQRGFKRAGAQSMILSLTKVNDRATYEFMNEFYKEYMISVDIRSAFNNSIKMMRTKYPTKPDYWRAFILMDVLK